MCTPGASGAAGGSSDASAGSASGASLSRLAGSPISITAVRPYSSSITPSGRTSAPGAIQPRRSRPGERGRAAYRNATPSHW